MTQQAAVLYDQFNRPLPSSREEAKAEVAELRNKYMTQIRAKYDAAQTAIGNQLHWSQADQLDPNAANTLAVRQRLRSRSRYEVIENNCYLKGILLTIANDFAGSGVRLQITDPRISKERRRFIEFRYATRAKSIKLRQKLWRWVIAKKVDGEACALAINNPQSRHPVQLDWYIIETDQISHPFMTTEKKHEVDGVKFDKYMQPEFYSVLNSHPGSSSPFLSVGQQLEGRWIKQSQVINWFRKERAWLRGIPETTPCLPLCAVLRRYTLAVLRAAEFAADIAGVLSTEGPPSGQFWDTFDSVGAAIGGEAFPTEHGMFVTLPWGYQLHQIEAKHPMQVYDNFVDSLLREIARPLMVPYNRAAGSSKDSNMASAVVDEIGYIGGIWNERYECQDEVLEKDLALWWNEGVLTEDYFTSPLAANKSRNGKTTRDDFTPLLRKTPDLLREVPEHTWRWDTVGIVHTDPKKVADARAADWMHGFRTDQQVIEEDLNENYDDWVEQQEEALENRKKLGLPSPKEAVIGPPKEAPLGSNGKPASNGKPSSNGAAKKKKTAKARFSV